MNALTDTAALARSIIVTGVAGAHLAADERERFARAHFGGYVFFARNGRSASVLRHLTDQLRSLHDRAPLFCLDQEGGRVARLREEIEPAVSMRTLGELDDERAAADVGEQLAFDVRRAGCNVNFAPVIDVAAEPRNTVIGTRAFGSDAQKVIRLARSLADAMAAGGVCPVFKHFPGHGSTTGDSHLERPVVTLSREAWRQRDGAPFAALAPQAAAIMSAHVVFTAFDAQQPATLSRAVLTDLLRGEFGFRGVCFTDCLHMEGAGPTADAAADALAAGADCLLISHDSVLAEHVARRIADAVERGDIPRARLEEAADRVAALRSGLAPPLALDGVAPHPGLGRRLARRALRVLRGVAHAHPLGAVAISFEPPYEAAADQERPFSLVREAPALQEIALPLDPNDDEIQRLQDEVHATGRRPLLLLRRAHLYPGQMKAAQTMCRRFPDSIAVSLREPDDAMTLLQEDDAQTIVCTFGDDAAAMGGLADALFTRA